jgi:hypothetical protein
MQQPELQITPPYGYDEIVPLQKDHKVLIRPGTTPGFCRSINALAVSYAEVVAASRDYPIVFASGDGGSTFAPVAVLGLAQRQNLFLNAQGDWDPATYVPAFVRRYPFCVSKVYVDGVPRGERMVCVARAHLRPNGTALFDDADAPTAQWSSIEQLLSEYETDLDLTAQMCATFAKLGLFAPFQFQVLEANVPSLTLEGMYRIDETKLLALKPLSMKALVTRGLMGRIYAHFHSLENFARLYQRALAGQEIRQ